MIIQRHKFIILFLSLALLFPLLVLGGHNVNLPKITVKDSMPLNEIMQNRRSVRNLSTKELTLDQISQLLWAAQGITDHKRGFRTAPSAGALYPLEIYMATHLGLWHYDIEKHAIDLIYKKDLRSDLAKAAYHQNVIATAPINIIITGIFHREMIKYKERGIQFTYMEAGHVAQNILLEAVNLDLGAVPIGGFDTISIDRTLNLSNKEKTLYIIPVGYKNKGNYSPLNQVTP
ncbi:MAG: SagB/ThcOx family dehydrogenase [Gammaproteobacteria bacterium]|nr:SagB/ThcOx family dehydrogenase [Gammaproteobacteria bacterium]